MSLLLAAALSLTPCTIENAPDARCGSYRVFENRTTRRGRTIDLNIVVLPAKSTPSRDPIVILQGGPGQAATKLTDFYARVFEGARETRDIVPIDQRGTGKSNSLECDMAGASLLPVDKVTQCRDQLKTRASLDLYTTGDAVGDLEEVRSAFGYDALNLFGTSYGTRVALEYARRFPKQVRSMILKGVVAPTLRYTVDPAIDTEASLQRVLREAAPQFPNLREKVPSGDDAGFEIRAMLHSLPGVRALPSAIVNSDAALWSARAKAHYAAVSKDLSFGMFLSVVCAEDIWRVSDAEAKRITAGTVTGDYWHRSIAAACAVWPHKPPQKDVATIVQSDLPTLLISGAYDPVTPPRQAEAAARGLKKSRHVIVKFGSHSFAGMTGCVDKIMSAFVVDPDPGKVDASCADKIAPPVFDK